MPTIADTLIPRPQASNFDLSRTWTSDYYLGSLVPAYIEEVLPGDMWSISSSNDVWTNPLETPLLGSLDQEVAWFFIPTRLYQQDLDINKRNFAPENSAFPYFSLPTFSASIFQPYELASNSFSQLFGVPTNSLLDYLGVPPGTVFQTQASTTPRLNAIPLIGYFDIFRNYYAAQEVDTFPMFFSSIEDGVVTYTRSTKNLANLDALIQAFVSTPGISWDSAVSSSSVNLGDLRFGYNTTYTDAGSASQTAPQYTMNRFFLTLWRCFRSDWYTSWLNNTTYTAMQTKAKINVVDNILTINQVRQANATISYYEAGLLSGGRYDNWVYALFGVHTDQRLCIPELLGVSHSPIIFQDIVNQALSDKALGQLGALGRGSMRPSRIRFSASEHGYLMAIYSIVPNVSYAQGLRPYLQKSNMFDLASPKFQNIGFQPLHTWTLSGPARYNYNLKNKDRSITFYDKDSAIGVQPAYIEYETAVNEVHGSMVPGAPLQSWSLSRVFDPFRQFDENGFPIPGLSLAGNIRPYPSDPAYRDSPYATPQTCIIPWTIQDLSSSNIMVKFNFDVFVRRYLSKHNMPKLA
ncbi:major capsid protein [Dipodfec virus UOA04_Rod_768]|nr:major capsid protein [Dipodfec virus UOA04_Rod_768]